jgi:hypothetical protein
VQTSLPEWGLNPLHKSLFRASGLALLTIFTISALTRIMPLQQHQQPAAILKLINQLLDQSPLLCLALLLLLLSLSDHITAGPGRQEQPRQGLRDRLLIRGRALVGLLALIYLLAIPVSLLQAQALRNIGDRILDQQALAVERQLREFRSSLAGVNGKQPSLAALRERYPWLGKITIDSSADVVSIADSSLRKTRSYYDRLRATGRRELLVQSLRLSLVAAIYAGLIGYLWLHWPISARPQGMAHSRHGQELGVDLEEGYLEAGLD